ncbi:MAG: ArsR family transcriptional regulator [Candidatus Aminicenantes bacterium]|nr:MAG: ArsR family transcriptional regulator [Candidatus Aminicenantes bacterium]
MLRQRKMNVGKLADILDMPIANVSQHLKALRILLKKPEAYK